MTFLHVLSSIMKDWFKTMVTLLPKQLFTTLSIFLDGWADIQPCSAELAGIFGRFWQVVLVARPPSRKFCWELADDESGYAPGGAASFGHNAAEITFVCDERLCWKAIWNLRLWSFSTFRRYYPSMSGANMYVSKRCITQLPLFPGQLAVVSQRQFRGIPYLRGYVLPWTKSFDAGLALVLKLGQIWMVEVEMNFGTVEVI